MDALPNTIPPKGVYLHSKALETHSPIITTPLDSNFRN